MKRSLFLAVALIALISARTRAQDPVQDNGNKVAGYLMDGHSNNKTLKKTVFKFEFALGYEQVPAITNTTSADGVVNPYSTYDVLSYPTASTAVHFWYNPTRFISLRLKPCVSYGFSVGSGASGYYFDYSGDIKLLLGTSVKVFGEAAYIAREGTYSMDQDEADASVGIATDDGITTTGSFAYSTTRLGGGLYFETSQQNDSYIELGVFRESLSLSNSGTGVNPPAAISPMVYKATFVFGKFLAEATYGANYGLDGTPLYSLDTNGAAQRSYLEIKLGAIFNL
jgi:hypothetical protein